MTYLADVYRLGGLPPPVQPGDSVAAYRRAVDRLVSMVWDQLAAAAWGYHSEHGRGLVQLYMNELLGPRWADGGRVTFGYMVSADIPSLGLEGEALATVTAVLATYDPSRSVVVVGRFRKPDMTFDAFARYTREPAPPVAARAQRN
jgi:hypothetical protein